MINDDVATQVTLEFDPNLLRLDMNNDVYLNRVVANDVTTTISGNTYIKKITFTLNGESVKNVKFYKVNKSQNYTYPGVQATSPITVTT